MDRVVESDDRFHRVISNTTRPPRDGEVHGQHFFFNDFEDGLAGRRAQIKLDRDVRGGRLVQHAEHPTTGHRYWSTIDQWTKASHEMMATLPSAFEELRRIPFLGRHALYLVTEPEVWEDQINRRLEGKRDEEDPILADTNARLREAEKSLKWALSLSRVIFIDNTQRDNGDTAASEVIEYSTRLRVPDSESVIFRKRQEYLRDIAKQMLELAEDNEVEFIEAEDVE